MTRIFLLFTSIIIFLAIDLLAQPSIEVIGGTEYNWGDVKPVDSPLKKRIYITNKGNEPLRVYEVKPSCGCTTAPIDKDVLMPGDTAKVDITLNLKDDKGEISKHVSFMTNDPKVPTAKVYLKANVIVPLQKMPNYLPFGMITLGEKAEAKMTLTNNTNKDITIMRIVKTPLDLNINLEKGTVIKAGQTFEVVSYMTPTSAGKFECAVTITTDNIDAPRLQMSGWGRVNDE